MMNRFYRSHKLQTIILVWLETILLISLIIASVAGLLWQDRLQNQQAFSMIDNYLTQYVQRIDVAKNINKEFDEWMSDVIDGEDTDGKEAYFDDHRLERVAVYNRDRMSEVSVVNAQGIITYSSNPNLRGYDIINDEQLSPFMCLLDGESSYSDTLDKTFFEGTKEQAYIGRAFRDKSGFMLFAINKDNYSVFWNESIEIVTEDSKIGMTGYMINCDKDGTISSITHTMEDKKGTAFEDVSLLPESEGEVKETITTLYGKKCYVSAMKTPDYYIIGAYPVDEADQFQVQNNIMFIILFFAIISAFLIVFFLLIKRIVIKEVEKAHASLNKITNGDLEERVTVGGSVEFTELSSGINETVDKLKGLIEEENLRVQKELENARNIQESSVPQVFPEDERYSLYATMNTAKAVGGDFYDFFMVNDNTLAIVMADVSGKGMPAALYMMRAKTLIKFYAEQGLSVDEVASKTNVALCRNESAKMFVTVWFGFLSLDSGVLSYVHAGHTLPVLVSGENVSFINQKKSMVMGGFEYAKYLRQEVILKPGDSIYLYTDGVTEAKDVSEDLYGERRLLEVIGTKIKDIDDTKEEYCKKACEIIYDDINDFTKGAEQYDDITMMMVKFGSKT